MNDVVTELIKLRQIMATRLALGESMPPSYEYSYGNKVEEWDIEKDGSVDVRYAHGGQRSKWSLNDS